MSAITTTILIVDDEPHNLDVLNKSLQESGYRVLVAIDGEKALKRVSHIKPDLILLDVKLPGIDGFEACRRLKAMDTVKDVPIIFITVETDAVNKVKGLETGAVDYIIKPFQPEEVMARIDKHLTIHRLQKQLEEQNMRLQREIAERRQAEEALREHALSLENLEKIDRVISQSTDLEKMLNDVLNVVLSIFDCDRAWLLYPCDPEAPAWRVPMEKTKPGYPGACEENTEYPMTPDAAEGFRDLLATKEPIVAEFKPKEPDWDQEDKYGVRSAINIAVFPKAGKPWIFGLHQCSRTRIWTKTEQRLFREISQRVGDGLSSLRFLRDLTESEKKAHDILNNTKLHMWAFDGEYYSYMNNEWYDYTGQDPALPLTIERWTEIVHPGDLDTALKTWLKHWETKTEHDNYFRLKSKDGEYRYFYCHAVPILNDDGSFKHFQGFNIDITERRQAEESLKAREAFLDRIIEQSPFAMWISDSEGILQRANPSLKKFLNLTDEQLVGKYNAFKDSLAEKQGLIPLFRTVYEQGKSIRFTCDWDGNDIPTMDLKGSNAVSIEAAMFPIYNLENELTNVVLSWVDITERKQAEEALRESEAQLNGFMESATDGFILFDAELNYLKMNKAAMDIASLTQDDIAGKNILDVVPNLKETGRYDKYKKVVETGEVFSISDLVPHPKFGRKHLEIKAFRVGDGLGYIFNDITERKRTENALQIERDNFSNILETMNDGVYIVNRHYDIQYVNRVLQKDFGSYNDQKCYFYFHERTSACPWCKNQEVFAGKTVHWEFHVAKNGRTYDLIDTPLKNHDGSISKLEIFRDITERKQADVELRQAKEAAEASNKAKSAFLANISHELRTPLNAVLGFSQLLVRSRNFDTDERKYLEIIHRNGEHLLKLINDVLDISKIEAGRTVLTENDFDLYRLMDDVENMFRLKPGEKGLQTVFACDAEVPQYVRTDEGKLRQVLVNLIDNAIKFTENGSVTVRVWKIPGDSPEKVSLTFEVEDTGKGIASGELDSLFDAFVQSESGLKSHEGTGLGLPISRKFVHMMGGDITAESKIGKGSVFRFVIQAETAESAEFKTVQPGKRVIALEPGQPVYRILIADNNADNRMLLVRLVTLPGFELREAEHGKEAVDIWKAWKPHLIFMDISMPVTDGYEATREVRKHETFRFQTKIIAVTANAFEEGRVGMLSAGCDDFVCKPLENSEIFDVIHRHLGVRFVYEDAESDTLTETGAKTAAMITEMLTALPSDLLTILKQAATDGDSQRLHQTIAGIRQHDAMLAEELARLTDDFAFDTILNMIQKLLQEN